MLGDGCESIALAFAMLPAGPLCVAAVQAEPPRVVDAQSKAWGVADQTFQKGKYVEADALYASFISNFPADERVPAAISQRAMCSWKLGKKEDAVKTWNWLVYRYPTAPVVGDAYEQMAMYFESKGNLKKSSQLTSKLLQSLPEHPAAVRTAIKAADAMVKRGAYSEAVAILSKASAKLGPDGTRLLHLSETMLSARLNPDKILDAANLVLKSDPNQAAMLYEAYLSQYSTLARAAEAKTKLGWCLYSSGQSEKLDRAEKLWIEVITDNSKTDSYSIEIEC